MRKVYTPAPKKKQKNLHYSAPISSPAMFPRYRSLIGGKIAGTHVCTKTREKTINYAVFDNVLSINKSIKRLFCLFMKVGMAKWAYNFHTHDCSHVWIFKTISISYPSRYIPIMAMRPMPILNRLCMNFKHIWSNRSIKNFP